MSISDLFTKVYKYTLKLDTSDLIITTEILPVYDVLVVGGLVLTSPGPMIKELVQELDTLQSKHYHCPISKCSGERGGGKGHQTLPQHPFGHKLTPFKSSI